MEASALVIEVRYGDILRRFDANVVDTELEIFSSVLNQSTHTEIQLRINNLGIEIPENVTISHL